jgi:hypothetical protein
LDELMQGRERSEQGRLGLGVWITARILHTLGGSLRLEATPGFATTLMAEFTEPPALYGNPAQEAI